MSDRTSVPCRRPHALFEFQLNPWAPASAASTVKFTASLGWPSKDAMRAGDDPVEVFVSCNKSTDIAALGTDIGVLVSLLRQHGCTFDTMRRGVIRDNSGEAATLVGRLLDEVEKFRREEAMALAGAGD